jgi:alpha-tubulin suppressor-like RCC1 family protein
VTKVVAGSHFSLALTKDCHLYSWGWNGHGNLGLGKSFSEVSVPTRIPNLEFVDISAGIFHCLALLKDGTLVGWGSNSSGQLGRMVPTEISAPVPINMYPLGGKKQKIASFGCVGYSSFALMEDGELRVWGQGNTGNLGLGHLRNVSEPESVPGLKFLLPLDSSARRWKFGFRELFLGRTDETSEFFQFPDEILYHFVEVSRRVQYY